MGVKQNQSSGHNSHRHDGKDCVLGADVDPGKCTWCGQVLKQTIKTRASQGGTCRPNTYICAVGDGAIEDCMLYNATSVPLENSSFPSGHPSLFPITSVPNDSSSVSAIMKVMSFIFLVMLTVLVVVVVVKRNEFCSKIESLDVEDPKQSIEVTVCSEPYPFFKTDSETIIYADCAETPSKMMEYEALPTPLENADRTRMLSCESLSLSTVSFTAISIISQEDLYEHTTHVIPQTDISINVCSKLGSGVEGLVLEGTYHGTHVACKTIQGELDTYLREGDLFFDVSQHPNICRFYGVTVFDGQVYLVSELFRDSSLRNVLRSGHFFSIAEKVTWCRQLAAAVLHLHRHDVLHCDIALRNVLVDITSRKIALTDFGHARRVDGVSEVETFAVRWTAPEVLKCGSFTKASDIYSIGITSIEILENGLTPFGDLSIQEVQSSVVNNGLTPRISEKIDADIVTIINNCLKNDAHNRTSSQELYDAWISYETRIHKIKHHRRTLSVQKIVV